MSPPSHPDYEAHLRTWQIFVKVSFITTVGVVAALVLMAVFLL